MSTPWEQIIQKIMNRASGRMEDFEKGNYAEAFIPLPREITRGITGKGKDRMPAMEDPEERALASYVTRRKRAFQTGTAMDSQRNALLQAMKTGTEASFKVGGGTKGLNMMNQMFNQYMLGLQDASLAGEAEFSRAERDQKTRLSQKKLELGLLKYHTEQAQKAQDTKEEKSNKGAMFANMFGGMGGEANPYGSAGESTSTTGTNSGIQTSSSSGTRVGTGVGNE